MEDTLLFKSLDSTRREDLQSVHLYLATGVQIMLFLCLGCSHLVAISFLCILFYIMPLLDLARGSLVVFHIFIQLCRLDQLVLQNSYISTLILLCGVDSNVITLHLICPFYELDKSSTI